MTLFRPCIDLHQGRVKQIVGKTLGESEAGLETNFVASEGAAHFARLYQADDLRGGHIIKLGPGNDEAALEALRAWPGNLQLGGGINPGNARYWLESGASKVIVTSFLFEGVELSQQRLQELSRTVSRDELVIDLSCQRVNAEWHVATNRWQTVTTTRLEPELFAHLSQYAGEFLVHAVDVEGQGSGIDEALVAKLGRDCGEPCTYAGGARAIEDLDRVAALSQGRVDLTFGSCLDLFGGTRVRYRDCVAYNRQNAPPLERTPAR